MLISGKATLPLKQRLRRPPTSPRFAPSVSIRAAFYVPADLNIIDGSSVWAQSTAEVLHADERLGVVMPLRAADRRLVITGALRGLDRVALVDGAWFRAYRRMTTQEAVRALRWLDESDRFDVVIARGFEVCSVAVASGAFAGRLWSAYALEPERDLDDPAHRAALQRIVAGSRFVIAQTEGVGARLETLVPGARGKVLILPPAVPVATSPIPPMRARLFYTGKFAPQYPFPALVRMFQRMRGEAPSLEFDVAGDKIHHAPGDGGFAAAVERALSSTEGLTWHGGIARDDVFRLLARGGIALNIWDPLYASTMNDLVVPSKTLDYCVAGVPVIAHDTSMHRAMFGDGYPLLADGPDAVEPLVRRLLADEDLYRTSAERARAAMQPFTYPEIAASLRPAIDASITAVRPSV